MLDIHRYIEKYTSQNTSEKEFSVAPLKNNFNKMKLLRIDIQSFDGQSDLWSDFYDNFQCAIHENSSLSNIQKMTYLKTLFRGSVFCL